jgi:hypothetical protein
MLQNSVKKIFVWIINLFWYFCNKITGHSYNQKNITMKKEDKLVTNILKIIKVTGFYIIFKGDPSVGIFDSQWELRGDFLFDTQDELEEFRAHLSLTYESYVGERCQILTFEEHQARIEEEK